MANWQPLGTIWHPFWRFRYMYVTLSSYYFFNAGHYASCELDLLTLSTFKLSDKCKLPKSPASCECGLQTFTSLLNPHDMIFTRMVKRTLYFTSSAFIRKLADLLFSMMASQVDLHTLHTQISSFQASTCYPQTPTHVHGRASAKRPCSRSCWKQFRTWVSLKTCQRKTWKLHMDLLKI